jgi:YVTN family beta-propeller protein
MPILWKMILLSICLASEILPAEPAAYVINTSAETLSKIDIPSGVVSNDILTLGSDIHCYPNQIIIRDTLAYVLLSGTSEIQIINLTSESTVGWIILPPGSSPYWMTFLNDRYVYVTLLTDNSLAKIDVETRQMVKTVPTGLSPEGVVMYDHKAYIAITAYDFGTWSWGQGRIDVYNTETDSIIGQILVGKNPQFLDIDGRGKIHVSCTGDYASIPGTIYIIDIESDSVIDSLAIGGQPGQIAVSPDNAVYLAAGGWTDNGEVLVYNALTGEILHSGENPLYVDSGATGAVAFQDSTVFISTFGDRVLRIDAAGDKLDTYHVGDGPVHLDFNYLPGDANGDWDVNVGDPVFLINYIFKSGGRPAWPAWRADVNTDGEINVGDAVYLIYYIFRGGARPQIGPTWIR